MGLTNQEMMTVQDVYPKVDDNRKTYKAKGNQHVGKLQQKIMWSVPKV